jgi:hypothetical protein
MATMSGNLKSMYEYWKKFDLPEVQVLHHNFVFQIISLVTIMVIYII